jgi:hypothetical protein
MTEPPEGYQNLQEAVEAFLRSPLPRSPASADAAEPWVPGITDMEEPTALDAIVEHEPELVFTTAGAAIVTVALADAIYAVAIHDGPDVPGNESLPIIIAEGFASGDHVRVFGRWANVQLTPETDDWPSGRMFVIERYERPA